MKKKKILTLVIFVLIFIIIGGWQIKPKQKKIYKKEDVETIKEKDVIGGVDLRKIEENFSTIQKKIKQIESKINIKQESLNLLKNPLKPWIIKKEPEKIIIKKIQEEEKSVSEIKSEPKKPDFKISGIVYDDKKSYVIINNEVKEEGEKISNFIIQKIYPEKIIIKDEMGNFFSLNFEFEKGE